MAIAGLVPHGFEVVTERGFASLHKDRAAAERYAVACHAVAIEALYTGRDVRAVIEAALARGGEAGLAPPEAP